MSDWGQLRKRLESVEDQVVPQRHRELVRQTEGRSDQELMFFIVHGYWTENANDKLPDAYQRPFAALCRLSGMGVSSTWVPCE